ncbi:SCO family protein [Nocardioides sp. AE5]|uniref:SCO family protein n=1 Tax=Nocardioides sp. AE5 TaxID=2962573 RepID=UPI0028819227|nr:SCO family protein [Nocardioides sp. AE5]MDT0201292.1 SCO family protein [Nocardioides sp. AE5]
MAERRSAGLLTAAAMSLALLLGGCGDTSEPGVIQGGQETRADWTVADTTLNDTSGADFQLTRDADKKVTLVFFGYTNCPDICPMVMANLASAMTRLDDDQRARVEVLFVTTDPARDTEEVLRGYLDRYDPSFIGLTGDLASILELGGSFHIAIEEGEKLPSGGYDVAHGDQVFFVEEDGSIPMYWSRETSSAVFANDIATLLEG